MVPGARAAGEEFVYSSRAPSGGLVVTLLAELRRRNVFRMAGLYLVGAWLVVQVAATLLPVFEAPAWLMKAVVAALFVGFFAALVFAWIFELTPEGLKRDVDVSASASIAPRTARRMDLGIIVVLLLALGYFALDKFVLGARRDAVATIAVPASLPTRALPAPIDERSIAVLPFDDLSPARDQAYFSEGVAEELLDALADVPGLKVAGRASSSYYAGRDMPLAEVGNALGVATVLEGSVRKQDDQVRIAVRLVRAHDGQQLWSDTYDGDLKDVFALQERIARSVVGRLPLLLDQSPGTPLVKAGTADPEAYQLYLQATSIFNRRDRTRLVDAIAALRRAVERDPRYARAFARLASLHVVLASYAGADPRETHEQVMRYSTAALALDPESAEAWAARGASLAKFGETQVESRDAFEEAMRLDPDDSTATLWSGLNLLTTGYRAQGTARIERALELDPLLPNALRWRGMLYLQDGDLARAEPLLQRAYDLGLGIAANALSEIAMAHGDTASSERLWIAGGMAQDFGLSGDDSLVVYRGIFGDAAAKQAGVRAVQGSLDQQGPKRALASSPLYLFRLGANAQGLEVLRERTMGEHMDSMNWLWTRAGAPIRALPEFAGFLRDFHLPALWDKYGAPDLCRKDAAGDYACD